MYMALKEAIDTPVVKNKNYSSENVRSVIQGFYLRGDLLGENYIRRNYPPLFHTAKKHFGNWKSAVESQGIDYSKEQKRCEIYFGEEMSFLDHLLEHMRGGKEFPTRQNQNGDVAYILLLEGIKKYGGQSVIQFKIGQLREEYAKKDSHNGKIILELYDRPNNANASAALIDKNNGIIINLIHSFFYSNKFYIEKLNCPPDYAELTSIGQTEILMSIDSFKWWEGFNFSTYISKRLKNRFLTYLNKESGLPKDYCAFVQRKNRQEEITTDDERIINLRNVSIDEPIKESEDYSLHDVLSDTNSDFTILFDKSGLREYIYNVVEKTLTPKEAMVINLRFGLKGHDVIILEDIGKRLGISRERVRQIESIALKKLRRELKLLTSVDNM